MITVKVNFKLKSEGEKIDNALKRKLVLLTLDLRNKIIDIRIFCLIPQRFLYFPHDDPGRKP